MKCTKEDIARVILDYLRNNSEAGDTLQGIAIWWLNLEQISVAVDAVSEVLEAMIKEGIIEKQMINGNSFIYRISKNN